MSKSQNSYAFQAAYSSSPEVARLDMLHVGITEFFGQRLSLAPLDGESIGDILELGSGSGAWAIQAALEFPGATVVAADQSRMPERPLPPNVVYAKADFREAFPFPKGKYDVVHARLVLLHLPDGLEVLRRVVDLVKPGGWLILEDPDDDAAADLSSSPGSAVRQFFAAWVKILRERGAEPSIGKLYEKVLNESGAFSEVNVRKVSIALSEHSDDPAENALGRVWKAVVKRNAVDLPSRFSDQGISRELGARVLEELEDPSLRSSTTMYFTWSRKR